MKKQEMSNETAGTKKAHVARYWVIGLLAVLFIGAIVYYVNRPLDPCVTISGIQTGTQSQENYILAKTGDAYYETDPSDEFSALFAFDEWEKSSAVPSDDPVLLLQFAELWVVELYSDGHVAASNGYAAIGKKSYAYYQMPEEAVRQVIGYFEEKGIAHEFGDGTIGMGTFRHE